MLNGQKMVRVHHTSNTNVTEKDLLDQAFEDGIGYGSDYDQNNETIYGTYLTFTKVQSCKGGCSDIHSNNYHSSRLPKHRYFNSTTHNKQFV